MKIQYSREAEKALRKLPKREQLKILRKIGHLQSEPKLGKLLQGELAGLRSLRAWPYRIIYRADQAKIFIITIGHRQGVYRRLQ